MNPAALAYRQAHIALCIARAQWWTAYANTPANLARRVQVGGYGGSEYLCKSELVDDAMKTADTHLRNAQDPLCRTGARGLCSRRLDALGLTPYWTRAARHVTFSLMNLTRLVAFATLALVAPSFSARAEELSSPVTVPAITNDDLVAAFQRGQFDAIMQLSTPSTDFPASSFRARANVSYTLADIMRRSNAPLGVAYFMGRASVFEAVANFLEGLPAHEDDQL